MGRRSRSELLPGTARRSWPRVALAMLLAAAMMLVAACGDDESDGGGAASGGAKVDLSGELGPAEDKEITVAIPFPDSTMYGFYVVGEDLGYYKEEGLSVKVITADNTTAAVVGGSADVGIVEGGGAIDAKRKNLPLTVLSGHFCRQNYSFAVQPDVKAVEDLNGKDVVLAGTSGDTQQFQREQVLKEEGWDLEKVDANAVYPGPDSATWREFFLDDKVSLMPFFDDDRPALDDYGANIIVDTVRSWPNSVQAVKTDWLKENPNTAVRFLRATLKAVEYITAPGVGEKPENKDKVLDIFEAHDLDIGNLRELDSPWALSAMQMCENLYFGKEAWDVTIETAKLDSAEYDMDMAHLEKAQELMRLDNSPPKDLADIYP